MSPKPRTSDWFRLSKYRNEHRAWLVLMDHFKVCGVWVGERNTKCRKRAVGAGEYVYMDRVLIGFCKEHEWCVARPVKRRFWR